MRKTITMIVPTYNGSKYLVNQIESIVYQLHSCDRIVCQDDSSTDNTVEVLARLQSKYAMLSYSSNNLNLGPNRTIWELMEKIETDLFVFCDQDDIWLPNRLDVVRKCEAGVLSVVGYQPFSEDNKTFKPILSSPSSLIRSIFFPSVPGCTIGGCTDTARKLYPSWTIKTLYDNFIIVNAILKGVRIICDEEVKVLYRRHGGNVTSMGFAPNGIFQALKRRVDLIMEICREIFK